MTVYIDEPRESFVIAEALAFAIEGLSRLPDTDRPESDIKDMEDLLDLLLDGPGFRLDNPEAKRRVDILQGVVDTTKGVAEQFSQAKQHRDAMEKAVAQARREDRVRREVAEKKKGEEEAK